MSKYFTLHAKYNQETIPFHFDITGDCFANHRIQKVKHFTLFETSGFVSIYNYFCDVFLEAVHLLKSGKELVLDIGVVAKIDEKDVMLHLCKMSVDLPREKISLDNHHVHATFHYSGKVQTIDNQNINISFVSNWIKEVRNSQSVEKQLKVEYFDDIKKHNIANINFYPYIRNADKPWLLKEIIRAVHHVGKAVDMSRLYPFTVVFKSIRGKDTLGYWFNAYKTIELDCRFDRDTIRSAFYHEYGHLLYDYAIIDNRLPEPVKKKAKQIIYTIIAILNEEEAMTDIRLFESDDFKKYLLTPTEVFARLFASYMIYEYDIKAQFEENHFNDYEVSTVSPLLEELLTLIQHSEPDYVYECARCGSREEVAFYGVVPHSENFVEYGWFCMDCLCYSKDRIKHLYQIKIDNISDEYLDYLIETR